MNITTLDTTAVTDEQIDRVCVCVNTETTPNTLFFNVAVDEFDEDNHQKAYNVFFKDGLFQCTCGNGDICEHIIWSVARIKEEKLQDAFTVETWEVTDRNEKVIGGILSRTYIVKNSTGEIESVGILPMNSYCSCKQAQESTDSSKTTCTHITAAIAFEKTFQNELAEHSSHC